ncbi:hypothetical protein D3C83_120170 [compost metagenome]
MRELAVARHPADAVVDVPAGLICDPLLNESLDQADDSRDLGRGARVGRRGEDVHLRDGGHVLFAVALGEILHRHPE